MTCMALEEKNKTVGQSRIMQTTLKENCEQRQTDCEVCVYGRTGRRLLPQAAATPCRPPYASSWYGGLGEEARGRGRRLITA